MNIKETYNIHKKIQCVFPFFKSKWLCKKRFHNYMIWCDISKKPFKTYWICNCCKNKIDFIL